MRRALIVGINDYPGAQLKGCVNDATAIASILKTNGDGSPNFDVELKLNITKRGHLKRHIEELFKGDIEAALFYFSGHGYIDATGGKLVTPDYEDHDEGISMEDVMTLANKSEIKNRVIILDCCHSGIIGSTNSGGSQYSNLTKGTTILTSSKADEVSVEIDGHGVFTSLLLDGLGGGAADITGKISPGSVYARIDQTMRAWGQRPVFKTNIDTFISLRDIEPSIPVEILRRIINYFPNAQDEYQLDPSFEETNSPDIEHKVIEPYANKNKVSIFKELQRMQGIGLIKPHEAPYMYFAAMESKSCKLTALGYHYWKLAKEGKI